MFKQSSCEKERSADPIIYFLKYINKDLKIKYFLEILVN